jgi:hypothetical protein
MIVEIGLFFAGLVLGAWIAHTFNVLVQRTATSLYMQAKGARGQAVKQEKDGELMAMLGDAVHEIKTMHENGGDWKNELPKIGIKVAAAHPIGAMRFGGELTKLFEKLKGVM